MIQNLKQPQGNYVRNCWDRATHPHSQRRRCGGRRRDRRARLRHPWAAAGPGRTTSRRTQPHASDTAPPTWRAPEGARGPGCGARGRWRSLAGQRADAPSHTQATQHRRRGGRRRAQEGLAAAAVGSGGSRPRCRWVAAGPGRASRSTTPSRRLACGDLAGGPPPTGAQSSPARRVRPDGTRNTSGATSNARAPARHSKRGRHQPTPCASALTHP